MNTPDEWSDHDPLAPMSAEVEVSLLAAIHSTPASHPDKEKLDGFLSKRVPMDLRAVKDA